MGKRQNTLKSILQRAGYSITDGHLAYPNEKMIEEAAFAGKVRRVYQDLGGVLSGIPLNLRKWDIEASGIAIELDEELHFNRYRCLTLRSPLYGKLSHFPLEQYRDYCRCHKTDCLRAGRYGKKWTTDSSEKQYGRAEMAGELTGNGAPRWKQRAFYDFVKDLTPLLLDILVVRISIWDSLKISGTEYSVGEILDKKIMSIEKEFSELIQIRTGR